MSLEFHLEEVVIQAINEGAAAALSALPDTLNTLQAVHGHSDDPAPSAAIYVEAVVVSVRNGHSDNCLVKIGTKIPLRTANDDGEAVDIAATEESALWEAVDFIARRLGANDQYDDGQGMPTLAPGAAAYAADNIDRLDWQYQDHDSKTERDDSDQFRHRIRKIACVAREKES